MSTNEGQNEFLALQRSVFMVFSTKTLFHKYMSLERFSMNIKTQTLDFQIFRKSPIPSYKIEIQIQIHHNLSMAVTPFTSLYVAMV